MGAVKVVPFNIIKSLRAGGVTTVCQSKHKCVNVPSINLFFKVLLYYSASKDREHDPSYYFCSTPHYLALLSSRLLKCQDTSQNIGLRL